MKETGGRRNLVITLFRIFLSTTYSDYRNKGVKEYNWKFSHKYWQGQS